MEDAEAAIEKELEKMKNEIEVTIRNLENNNPDKPSDQNPQQNNPTKTASSDKFPWKVIIISTSGRNSYFSQKEQAKSLFKRFV